MASADVITMRDLMRIVEAHHSYDNPNFETRFQPFKSGDTVRVFHGFWDMSDAVSAAMHGLSGRTRPERRYSYESNNNPHGLFVTLKFDVAREFTSRGAIMEFTAAFDDLESPVWPGNGYTVQGQMAQYFSGGATGRAQRKARRRAGRDEVLGYAANSPEMLGHVTQSDDPHKAFLLSTGREYQALFVGHLDPQDITAFWVANDPSKDGRYTDWTRLTPDQFLAAQGDDKVKQFRRMFTPNESFDGNVFLQRMSAEFRGDRVEDMLQNAAEEVRQSNHPAHRFVQYFDHYLWPKQLPPAMRWLLKTW